MKHAILFLFGLLSLSSPVVFASSTDYAMSYRDDAMLDYRVMTDHFFVDFSKELAAGPDSDRDGFVDELETSVDALEQAYEALIDEMGYDYPFDSLVRVQVYLDDTGDYLPSGAVGVFQVLSSGEMYLAANPFADPEVLKVTMVHEFFHLVQYFMNQDFLLYGHGVGFGESTAVWLEDEIYDDVNDYVNYVPDLFAFPDYSIFSSTYPKDTLFQYALVLWPKFVSENFGQESIRGVWEAFEASDLDSENPFKVYMAYRDYFESIGEDLRVAFVAYTIANLDRGEYDEGDLYEGELKILDGEMGVVTMPPMYDAPAPYASNYIHFANPERKDWFYFNFNRVMSTDYAVTLVPVIAGEPDALKSEFSFVPHSSIWEGFTLENVRNYSAIIAIVSPLEDVNMEEAEIPYFDEAQPYEYYANYFATEVALEAFQATIDVSADELESIEKEGEEPVLEPVSAALSLNLTLWSLSEEAAQIKWTKPQEKDFNYYLTIEREGEFVDAFTLSNPNQRSYLYSFPVKSGVYLFSLQVMVDGVIQETSSLEVVVPTKVFIDVVEGTEWSEALAYLKARDMVQGYADGTFKPEQAINRAEFLKLVVLSAYDGDLSAEEACFTDVEASAWYAPYVCTAKKEGWIQGYADASFKPSQTINLAEAIKILLEVQGESVESMEGEWYLPYLTRMYALGVLQAGEEVDMAQDQTRGDFALLLYRYLSL